MYLATSEDFIAAIQGETVDFDTGQGLVKLRGLTVTEVTAMPAIAKKATADGNEIAPLLYWLLYGVAEPRLAEADFQRIADNGSFSLVSAMAQRIVALSAAANSAAEREALDS
jgi:hypothetical protein